MDWIIERYAIEKSENTTLDEVMDQRTKMIEGLQKDLEEAGTLCKQLNSEIVSLREEKDKLVKQKHHDDYVIENQKYQLGKWAKENEELQEENEALKFFARRYLVVE